MTDQILPFIDSLAQNTSLPIFVVVGSVIEEIIAPIPSPIIMTAAGALAQSRGYGWDFVLLLALLGAIAKTLATLPFYILGDKGEDWLVPRFGKFIGVTHKDLEEIGQQMEGSKKNELIVAFVRAIPLMPSTPVSVVCGIIKMSVSSYLISTTVGFFFRELFFLVLGYTGYSAYDRLLSDISTLESVLTILMVLACIGIVGWLWYRRKTGSPADWLRIFKK